MIFVESLLIFVIIALIWMLVTLVIFKKLNKARIKGVILILLAFVAVAAVIFILGHFLEWHDTNEFCGTFCHSMDGPYASYTKPDNNTFMETHYNQSVHCAQCHSGPGLTGLGKSFLVVPNEGLKEYILGYDENDFGGHVPAENCIKGCHQEEGVDWKFEAPKPKGEGYSEVDRVMVWERREIYHPLTENGTNLHELKELDTCLSCHDPRHNSFGFTAEACPICHDVDEEELEHHGESTCDMATCHRNEQGEPVQPKLTGHNTVTDHCMECHSRNHPGDAFVPYIITNSEGKTLNINSSFCKNCHHETYEELANNGSKHNTDTDCTECHLAHKTRPDCLMCHDQESGIAPIHNVTEPFDECESCHEHGGHNPRKINFQTQIESENSEIVSKDFCNSCHESDIYDTFVDGTLHTRKEFTEDCLSCHDAHVAEVECSKCHISGGFGGLADSPDHNITQPFDDCINCHTHGHTPNKLNFTSFETANDFLIEDDFCIYCHEGQTGQLQNYGMGHESNNCSSCHKTHDKEEVDCLSCHGVDDIAFLPSHETEYQYEECTNCHVSGHAPKNITFPESGQFALEKDFCAAVSCHDGTEGQVYQLENYGAYHKNYDCNFCHNIHISYEQKLTVDTCNDCHSKTPKDHLGPYDNDQCLGCHNSAHDPTNRALHPGYNLSQRDYMSVYFQVDENYTANNFNWTKRGNHPVSDDCSECHISPEETSYPAAALGLMNASGTDCSTSCHSWIDPVSTGDPFTLLTSETKWGKHADLFDNETDGGCAGYCHQSDPESPVFDGSGHGDIALCLNQDCHGWGFVSDSGVIHERHKDYLGDPGSGTGCWEVCHKTGVYYGAPINGGCYDCHKSGHDPRIIDESPCFECHGNNM
ncbi:MAG: NapC/NirT family cytochrome c [Methanomassiliicoccales archaeon]|nr:MAG: NapC/NirT family cytochrome c [Methanomassiliicoccales archaeon]